MSTLTDFRDELEAKESAFIILVMDKPENEDDGLVVAIETNIDGYPPLVDLVLQAATEALLGQGADDDEL